MIRCSTTKKVYQTREIAEEGLLETHIKFYHAPGTGPIAVYQCEDCGYFHLTSKGPMNENLVKYLASGKADRQKEANHWMDKLKKK